MQDLVLSCLESKVEKNRSLYARFLLAPFLKGHALTVGTALRRALLSSVESIGITALYIQGITHEFSTVAGLRESVLELSLNFQKVVLSQEKDVDQPKSFFEGVQVGYLHVQGPRIVYANDLKLPLGVELVDPTQYIATLSTESSLVLKFLIARRGLRVHKSTKLHTPHTGTRLMPFYAVQSCPCKAKLCKHIFLQSKALHVTQQNKKQSADQKYDANNAYSGKASISTILSQVPTDKTCKKQSDSKTKLIMPYQGQLMPCNTVLGKGRHTKGVCKRQSTCSQVFDLNKALPCNQSSTLHRKVCRVFREAKIKQQPISLANAEVKLRRQNNKTLSKKQPILKIDMGSCATIDNFKGSTRLGEHSTLKKRNILETLNAQNISKAKKTKKPEFRGNRSDMCLRNVIPLDSSITPINQVNFVIETDDIHNQLKERLILEVWTNGSVHPRQAVHEAALSLIDMFSPFRSLFQLNSYSNPSLHLASRHLYKHKQRRAKTRKQEEKGAAQSTKPVSSFLSSFVNKTSIFNLKAKIKKNSLFFLYQKQLVPSIYQTKLDRSSLLESDIGELSLNLKTLNFLKQRSVDKLENLLHLSQIDLLLFLNGNKDMFYDIKRFLLKNNLGSTLIRQQRTRL